MPNPQGFCIFCNQPGLTKEHPFGQWLRDLLPEKGGGTQYRHFLHINVDGLNVIPQEPKKRTTTPMGANRRIVCGTCNTEMGKTQEAVAPVIKAMIKREDIVLGGAERLVLATWMASASMVEEYSDIPTKVCSPEERAFIRANRAAPPNWQIWVGRYQGNHWKQRYFHVGMTQLKTADITDAMLDLTERVDPNIQTTLVSFGEMFLFASSALPGVAPITMVWPWTSRLSPIWPEPAPDVNWPYLIPMSDAEMDALSNVFAGGMGESVRKLRAARGL